jgi:hypothetical protein
MIELNKVIIYNYKYIRDYNKLIIIKIKFLVEKKLLSLF